MAIEAVESEEPVAAEEVAGAEEFEAEEPIAAEEVAEAEEPIQAEGSMGGEAITETGVVMPEE